MGATKTVVKEVSIGKAEHMFGTFGAAIRWYSAVDSNDEW